MPTNGGTGMSTVMGCETRAAIFEREKLASMPVILGFYPLTCSVINIIGKK